MYKSKCIKCFLLFLSIANIIEYAKCQYSLSILLLSFDDGQGFLANGSHCNPLWYANQKCNIRIQVCVDLNTGNSPCSIDDFQNLASPPWYDLGQVTNSSNNITFQETTYKSWKNPMSFNDSGLYVQYKGFTLSLVATDVTTSSANLIDNYTYQFADGNSARDFLYYAHPRQLENINLEPTLTGVAWYATGNVLHTPPPPPPTTTTTVATTPYTGSTIPPPKVYLDCSDPLINVSGVYYISPLKKTPFQVYCDVVTPGKAYTVIQSRGPNNPNVDFNQTWANYSIGFGEVAKDSNYWVGLQNIYSLTNQNIDYGLRIDLCCGNTSITTSTGDPWYYVNFQIGDESTLYRLNATCLNGCSYGIATSTSVYYSDIGSVFSTWDNFTANTKINNSIVQSPYYCSVLNYPLTTNKSADHFGNVGGWWFGSCTNNLNGFYYDYGNTSFYSDTNSCMLNLPASGFPSFKTGTGIEMATYDQTLPKKSYTKVRMALYRLVNGPLTPPPVRDPNDFCKGSDCPSLSTMLLATKNFQLDAEKDYDSLDVAEVICFACNFCVDGKLSNNQTDCNPYYGAGIPCYPRPKICIEPVFDSDPNPDYCTYSFIDLGILDVGLNNTIDFNTNYGLYRAWLHPNKLVFPGGYSGFNVKLHIWNADRTNYQLIEKFYWNIAASQTGLEASKSGTADTSGFARTIVKLTWNTTDSVVPITTRLAGLSTQSTSPASKGPQPTPASTEGSASEGTQPTPANTEGSASGGPQPTLAFTTIIIQVFIVIPIVAV